MAEQRDDNKGPDRDSDRSFFRFPRGGGLFILILLLGFMVMQILTPQGNSSSELTYNQFLTLMSDPSAKIKSLSILKSVDGVELRGKRELDSKEKTAVSERPSWLPRADHKEFVVRLLEVEDSTLRAWAAQRNIEIRVEERGGDWLGYLLYLSPALVFLVLWIMMMRQGQNGPKGLFSFGKSRARVTGKDVPRVTFDDVAGCDEAKAELVEIIDFLKDPGRYDRLGGKIPRGVLLMGPPGTGKTLLAKAVAGEAKVPFFSMSGASFVEMFVGVGASRVRDLFEQAKKAAPCLIFIDEIDAVGRQRGAGLGGGHDEREQTLNQLLIEMDGFSGNDGVIIVAATNRPDILDPALLRPGRFDRRVVVDAPDVKGRAEILKVHTGTKIPLSKDVDLEVIARGTPGFSGADLANLCNEAALAAARAGKETVSMADFEAAKDKVYMGPERRSRSMTEADKKIIAYHEAGHAVVGLFTEGSDPLHKITIVPRGRALGLTWQLPESDRYLSDKEYLEGEIRILMGGRLAEELFVGKISTGASNDIQRATSLARKMVCDYGMSKLGPIHYGDNQQQLFLGRDIGSQRETSEDTARMIDAEVKRIVDENYVAARRLLEERRREMELLSSALLEYESLEAADVKELFEKGAISRPKPVKDVPTEPVKPSTEVVSDAPAVPDPA
ncbi:MAG TPA: ATP-dependent zinc metalloprotease FtsH [Fibrobacteria bacterium]|nr:ATP-dependent zinc metalloprotease FtsH [Fibrobacteria bacterium]